MDAEELYLKQYTTYGAVAYDDEEINEYDAMEAAEAAWDGWDER